MITPAFTAEVAVDGSYIRLRNTSTIPTIGSVSKCLLSLQRIDKVSYSYDLIAKGKLNDSVTANGVLIYPKDMTDIGGKAFGDTFPDGYYQLTLVMSDGTEVSALVNEGFTSTVEAALNRKIVDCIGSDMLLRQRRHRDYAIAQALVRSAKADARIGNATSFDAKISHVYSIFTREGVSYE